MSQSQTSIENDRDLHLFSENPFQTEIPLYEKEQESGRINAIVCVPDFYHVGFPNIGHQLVERQVNQIDGFFASRCYLTERYELLRESLDAPDLILISMSYEGSYIRALRVLDKLGIPLEASRRTEGDPIVVFGGRAVSLNPIPLFEFADVIGIGDSDELIQDICASFAVARTKRDQLFDLLVGKPGIILPRRYKVRTEGGYLVTWESRNAPQDIYPNRGSVFPHSWYLSPETDYNDIGYYERKTFFSMEIVKACASKCLFCAEGYNNGPMRFTNNVETITQLGTWAQARGADLVKLFFPANATVDTTKSIVRALLEKGLSPRVGSAKAEKIDREYIALVARSGQEKFAVAPETGDYELRSRLGKPGMTNEVLDAVLTQSVEAGIPNLDFYFIMNLPGESDVSFQRTIESIGRFRDMSQRLGLRGRIRISAPNFFPKAWTPFQYAPAGNIETYHKNIETLEHEFGDTVKLSSMKGDVDLLSQNIMSRGGIEAGMLLVRVYTALKEREEATRTFVPDTLDDWRMALRESGIMEEQYLCEKQTDRRLPWHHIRMYSSTDRLVKAWDVFRMRRITPLPIT